MTEASGGGDFNFNFNASFTAEQQRKGTAEHNYRRNDPVMHAGMIGTPVGDVH